MTYHHCTVSIVKEQNVDRFIDSIGEIYEEKMRNESDFYVLDIGGEPSRL